jgi:hypothetical protein
MYSNSTYELLGFFGCLVLFIFYGSMFWLHPWKSPFFDPWGLVLIMLCCFVFELHPCNCCLFEHLVLILFCGFFLILEPLEVQRNFICFHLLASKNNQVQFAHVFHFLGYDQPMTKFELTSELSNLSKVKNNPKKLWSNTNGWEMVKSKH